MNIERPHIALPESIDEAGVKLLEKTVEVHQYSSLASLISARRKLRTDAIIVRSIRIGAAVMDAIPGLRVIGRHGAGLDNIDLEAAEARGITVVNTPRSNTHSVAEYVIGAIYYLLKRFGETSQALQDGVFTTDGGSLPGQVQRLGLAGREVSACSLGIVGYGVIGREVARLAEAHGMTIHFYDPFVPDDRSVPARHSQYADLESLLQECDVITLHVPGSSGGPPLIDTEQIALMRPGSVLINAARGSIVSLSAVADAIQSGHLAGCAIDVFDREPPEAVGAIFEDPSVLATPHIAAITQEALVQMAIDVATHTLEALSSVSLLETQ